MIDGYEQYFVVDLGYFSATFWVSAAVALVLYLFFSYLLINGVITKITGNT